MKKKRAIGLAIKIGIVLALIIVFVLINDYVDENKKKSFVLKSDSYEYAYQVEETSIEDGYFILKGWFFEVKNARNAQKDNNTENNKLGIILYDLKSETVNNESGQQKKGIKLEVERSNRPEVNKYFSCEYDYSHCGFVAKIDKTLLDLDNGEYQVVFKRDESEINGIASNAYISKGYLQYYSPKEEIMLNVEGTDLEAIVNDGACVMSYPEIHICIYQYLESFYWIADQNYYFEDDGLTRMDYLVDTTQFSKLPEENIANGTFVSNLGFYFERKELTDKMNCGEYRVASCDIPSEYSVNIIKTGYYQSGRFVWQKNFRPIYNLDKK